VTTAEPTTPTTFDQLGLAEPLLRAVTDVGYEVPTPIQARTIPALLQGRDLIGQAQTGTGKTAAFALPLLQAVDPALDRVQALVLAPTRELALQVAEAVHTYSRHLRRIGVLPVYGGQPIHTQLKRLQRGTHVVIGTPGRVMDHLRRGSLNLGELRMVVLDEADEMLRMGFIDDVEWILSQAPAEGRQTALFSATMPAPIRRVAKKYLKDPVTVQLAHKTLTVPTIEQRCLNLAEGQKLDALTRILGTQQSDAVLIFARTKNGCADLAHKLEARGWAAEALHGDMSQAQREGLVRRLRERRAEIVVATDVAARGLDVEHISHVVNYDIPYDVEAYVHRIGRTGRAGRAGSAVLFVTPRERRMLGEIERFIGHKIPPMKMPTRADVAARTVAMFKESIKGALAKGDLDIYLSLVEDLAQEGGFDMAEVAAALARVALGDKTVQASLEPEADSVPEPEQGMVRLFLGAGTKAGVRPADVVGAIANEAGVPGREIGSIDVYERFTFVELPARYKNKVLKSMANSSIRGRPINIKPAADDRGPRGKPRGAEGSPVRRRPKKKASIPPKTGTS
jgi:ATP-dependent RNA helicase DeaD